MLNGLTIKENGRRHFPDFLVLVLLFALAFAYLRASPEFAANLPQDAGDFAVPAVRLLETGHLGCNMYGNPAPMGHPIGLSLLLLPAYMIFGHFIGNGIYMILACAVGTVALVYYIGCCIAGRLSGLAAGAFLITHNGFHLFSQKIMSEVPAIFLLTLALALLFYSHRHPRQTWCYLLFGVALGLAVIIRFDNIIFLASLTILAAIGFIRLESRRIVLIIIGLAPWLLLQGVYNRTHYGSFTRTCYNYHGLLQKPAFALRNATAEGYWVGLQGNTPEFAKQMDGNFMMTIKSVLDQVNQSLVFGPAQLWQGRSRVTYLTLILARTLAGLVGLVCCILWWKRNPLARAFLVWFAIGCITSIVFYTFYSWQEERFMLRLAPLFCLLNGIAIAAAMQWIERTSLRCQSEARILLVSAVSVVCTIFACFSQFNLIYQGDDNILLYSMMRQASSQIESNAIVVTNWDPLRVDVHMIQKTDRLCIPLSKRFALSRWLRSDSEPVPMYPFTAFEDSAQLAKLMYQKRPVYILIREPFDYHPPPPELAVLAQYFKLTPLGSFTTPEGRLIGQYLFRMESGTAGLPFSIANALSMPD